MSLFARTPTGRKWHIVCRGSVYLCGKRANPKAKLQTKEPLAGSVCMACLMGLGDFDAETREKILSWCDDWPPRLDFVLN